MIYALKALSFEYSCIFQTLNESTVEADKAKKWTKCFVNL